MGVDIGVFRIRFVAPNFYTSDRGMTGRVPRGRRSNGWSDSLGMIILKGL